MDSLGIWQTVGAIACYGVLALLLGALAFPVWAENNAVSCDISFENGLSMQGGVSPVSSEGVRLTAGRSGLAAEFVKGSVLTYATEGHFDPNRGTLEMWIRPNWDSTRAPGERFFWGVDSDPGKGNRTVLGFLGKEGKGLLYFGSDGAIAELSTFVDWRPGEWHHVKVCWDTTAKCRALYVDGERRHRMAGTGGMPGQQKVFHVGSLPCVTRWMGVLDGHEADAAIDDLRISNAIDASDFDQVRLAAVEDEKAKTRVKVAKEEARPAYERAWERLQVSPTLEGVAQQHVEVTWEDVDGLAAPMTQRVPIQARHHSNVVFFHPDLSIALGRQNDSFGVGFALGTPFQLPDMYKVTRKLHKGYQPIIESEWNVNNVALSQTAFTVLPGNEDVVSGREPQYLVIRMALRNSAKETRNVPLFLLLGRMEGSQNTNYQPFLGSASRWLAAPLGMTSNDDTIFFAGKPFAVYHSNGKAQARCLETFTTEATDPLMPPALTNVVRFDLDLGPGEMRTLDLITRTDSMQGVEGDLATMQAMGFDVALRRAETYWDRGLEAGMKLTTPDQRVNNIYRHLILSCLGGLTRNPDRLWDEPYQAPVWEGVWPWEFAHMAVPLSSVGYGKELEPSLHYFTERQTGLGKYEEKGRGPEGNLKSTYGCYTGNFLLRWMSETGSVMWALASKYQYDHDVVWLKENKESILAAWDWIQGERARTRRFEENGEKVLYYGLLPEGRVHDWDEWHHFFFSDTYSWKGMTEMAAAFQDAGFPEAERLMSEADEYRACILDAVRRAQFTDPGTGLLFVPNLTGYQSGERGGLWWADGPSCMFFTGLLDSATDPRFDAMVGYLTQTWGTLAGLSNRMDEPKELGKKNPFWYVNLCERGYFQSYLARNEIEKALIVFYSNLVYGMSHDCYQTVERIHVSDANYAPFQPNASGNGRMLDMFRRMVIDEQEPGVLWVLRGCPRRWFASGESISVENAPTLFGTMALHTRSTGNTITVDIDAPDRKTPREIRVVVRAPDAKRPAKITVNGVETREENGCVVLPAPKGHIEIVFIYGA